MRKYGIHIFNIDLNNSYIFLVYKTDFKIIPVDGAKYSLAIS